jgi:hypothetical protein
MRIFLVALAALAGCASAHPSAELAPLQLAQEGHAAPLTEDHFSRDSAGNLTPQQMKELLAGPVFLEAGTRLGVVPVESGYQPGSELPLPNVPAELTSALEGSGLFEMATEVSTDWPADRGVGGLRELAARYRAPYLLLYRQRFVDDSFANAWAVLDPTIIGALITPNQTLETDGVLEATLFDVQTGTLLFTVYARVHDTTNATVWHDARKVQAMQQALQSQAAKTLADQVLEKVRRLAAARPQPRPSETASLPES